MPDNKAWLLFWRKEGKTGKKHLKPAACLLYACPSKMISQWAHTLVCPSDLRDWHQSWEASSSVCTE